MTAEATTGRKGREQQDWGELAFDHNGSKVVNSEASHRRGLRRGRASDMVITYGGLKLHKTGNPKMALLIWQSYLIIHVVPHPNRHSIFNVLW